jgi:hypothetical protein
MKEETQTENTPKKGSTVYDLHSQQGYVNQVLPDGSLLVELVFEGIQHDSQGDEMSVDIEGPLQVWTQWFSKPPVQKKAQELLALKKEEDEIRTRIRAARSEEISLQRSAKERIDFLKQHEKLQLLDDFVSGKITHIVSCENWGSPEILTVADWESKEFRNAHCGLRLLSLFGSSKGDLTWKLNYYSDQSGNWTDVTPCTSLEQAMSIFESRALDAFEAWRKAPRDYNAYSSALKWADAISGRGLTYPEDLKKEREHRLVNERQAKVEKLRKELAEAEKGIGVDLLPPA